MNPKTNSGYDMYDMYDMWENLPFKGDTKRAYEALKTLYQEPHRAYHNLQHIKECLALSGRVREVAAVTEVLTFAIWYHDAIYDPKAKNNEERSADLFAEHAKAFGSEHLVEPVRHVILATKHSGDEPPGVAARYMLDIDLAILGAPASRFDEYDAAIRKEYQWVPEEQYRAARRSILQGFLERKRLYFTEVFHREFDRTARENLRRSVARLSQPV